MSVRLISITQGAGDLEGKNAQEIISYTTRVSNPENQENFDTAPKLLARCMRRKEWSPFELADMTVEIITSRAIAQQILRHRSFSFQEFSQRYSKVQESMIYEARSQDPKNRQNSIDDLPEETKEWFIREQEINNQRAISSYEEAILKGVAKEQARFLLPLSMKTKLYMKGSVRSWIHYIEVRTGNGTQKEHQIIALEIKKIFSSQFPDIAGSLGWA